MLDSLQYRVSGGQPAVAAAADIAPDGEVTVTVETSWSLPPDRLDRVGTFAGQLRDDEWDELRRVVDDEGLIGTDLQAEPASPDPSVRVLTLHHDGGETQLSVTGTQERTADLEGLLASIMRRVVADGPQAAIEMHVDAPVADGEVAPKVTLEQIGTEPLPLLLLDPDDASQYVRVTFVVERELVTEGGSVWLPVDSVTLPRTQVEAWADEQVFPAGVHDMAPGTSYELPGPTLTVPDSDDALWLRTRVELWLPGEGPSRRQVTIEPEPLQLSGTG